MSRSYILSFSSFYVYNRDVVLSESGFLYAVKGALYLDKLFFNLIASRFHVVFSSENWFPGGTLVSCGGFPITGWAEYAYFRSLGRHACRWRTHVIPLRGKAEGLRYVRREETPVSSAPVWTRNTEVALSQCLLYLDSS